MIFRKIYKMYLRKFKPIKSIDKCGLVHGSNLNIYGRVEWGTEPWIIRIGNNVHITDGVKFITHDGGTLLFRKDIPDLEITGPIIVGNNVYFGNNVIVLPGVTIGDNVIIGAGAVVTKNIPNNSVAVGVPAKVIETADEYLEKAKTKSLHLGHLKNRDKDIALMKFFGYKGKTKGIYF
jgi:acetyltransferase-like isoleucine patch superfamily enzyme